MNQMINETMTKGELDIIRISKRKSVPEILEALCDFYYIYGKDRSHFMGGWTNTMRLAIVVDSAYFDQPEPQYVFRGLNKLPITGHHFFIKRTLNDIFDDIQEHGAYAISDKEKLIERCCELFEAAWKRNMKVEFKQKLAGTKISINW